MWDSKTFCIPEAKGLKEVYTEMCVNAPIKNMCDSLQAKSHSSRMI